MDTKKDKDETKLAALTKSLLAMPRKERDEVSPKKRAKKKPANKRA